MNPSIDLILDAVTRFPALGQAFLTLMDTTTNAMTQAKTGKISMEDVETEVENACARMACASLAEVLIACDPASEEVEIEGKRYRRMALPSRGIYYALRGPIEIQRHLYREVGVHNGPTVVPLEQVAGIIDGRWTPRAAVAAAHLLQDEPSRDAIQTCKVMGTLPYSRCSLERGGHVVGDAWEEIRVEAEDHIAATFEIPSTATSLALSVDRVSLPMPEPLGKDAEGHERLKIVYHLVYCGIWTLYDAKNVALYSVRYGRMPAEGHETIEEALRGDAEALLRQRPDLKVVGLADGAKEMQYILDRILAEIAPVAGPVQIDFWHLLERLMKAVVACGYVASEWGGVFKAWLKEKETGVELVEAQLQSWSESYPTKAIPEVLQDAMTYMNGNRERMRYKTLLDAGLPIGSGPVEATCKTLVSTRMKRSGARWKAAGGQAVLSLRSLARSSRWDAGMQYLLSSFKIPVSVIQKAA